ncbi:MAG: hypothetical protein WAK39_13910, partial [Pseudolabrys sp.]
MLAPWPLPVMGEWDSPVRAGSLVLCAWVRVRQQVRWHWRGGHWRGGRFWPWGLGAGVALAAALPYYGGYGYRLRILCPVGTRLWLGERLQLSVLWRLRLLLIT